MNILPLANSFNFSSKEVLIVLAVLGFNFVGDGLRDAMDPKSKK